MQDGFMDAKNACMDKLYKPDKSKKGSVDEFLISLIDLINEQDNYYTKSSCSGRISVFTDHGSRIKADGQWLFVSHETSFLKDVLASLQDLPESVVFFRSEPFILHVACRTLEDAKRFVQFAQNNGYKHAAILGLGRRPIVQVVGVEKIEAPIAKDGKLLVSADYIKFLVDESNVKLTSVHAGIKRLETAFKKEFL